VVGVDAVAAVHHVRGGVGERVGVAQEVPCERDLTPLAGQEGEGIRGVDLDLGIAGATALVEDLAEEVDDLRRALTASPCCWRSSAP
jgi:hypothetical protein